MEQPAHTVYGRVAQLFVENKQLSLLLVIASFVFGALSFYATPKQYDPQITIPAFQITTQLSGASVSEIESLVTNTVESHVAQIPDVDEITSETLPNGVSVVHVLFTIGSDPEDSAVQLQEEMQRALGELPPGSSVPHVERIDPDTVPVLTIALTSDVYTQDGLRELAYDIKDSLKNVEGVGGISVFGGRQRELQVQVNTRSMAHRGVSLEAVTRSIQANNAFGSVGVVQSPGLNVPIEVRAAVTTAADIAHVRVGGSLQAPVYVEDVATVTDGYDTTAQSVRIVRRHEDGTVDRTPVVFLAVSKVAGTNISDVTEAVRTEIDALQTFSIPKDVTIAITRDEGGTAHEEIMTLTEHLAFAIIIVTLTLLYFLGLRVALVVATAIPLTLALVFITSFVFGSSINRITLFALIFSLGLLVDDAIVVIENIHRHLGMRHVTTKDAVVTATSEVGSGVFLSTITAVVVFAPMGIVTGMMGAYMGPIAFFAPVARLASLVVAYTFSPYLSSMFLKKESGTAGHGDTPAYVAWYTNMITSILDNVHLQKKILFGVGIFTTVVFLFPFVGIVHFRMLPKADKQQFYVYIDANEQAPFETTDTYARSVEQALLTLRGVREVETFVATAPIPDFSGLFRGSTARTNPYQATIKVRLFDPKDRDSKSEDIVVAARRALAPFQSESVRIQLVEDPPGPPVRSTMLVKVKGPDGQMRDQIAEDVTRALFAIRGVTDIDSSVSTGLHSEVFTVRRDALARTGVTAVDVMNALQMTLYGLPIGMVHTQAREVIPVLVHTDVRERDSISDLQSVQIATNAGAMVSLGQLVHVSVGQIAQPILHDDKEPTTLVTAETEGRSVVYTTIDLMKFLYGYTLPDSSGVRTHMNLFGFTYEDMVRHELYTVSWGGEFEMTLKNFRDLGAAMILSYLLIYGILVAQFKSFRSAGLIMTTIVLAFAGVIPGFAILDFFFGMYFSATSMIGAIALGGIVVGNAILLLDFIEQLRARGLPLKEAVVRACETRVQPIVLTAITAVLGAAVIVADPVWSGLAWALMFGLSFSTVLTLVIFPILYVRSVEKRNA